MANKFTRTGQLEGQFQEEKVRLDAIRVLVAKYKSGIQKQSTYHAMRHDTTKNQIL